MNIQELLSSGQNVTIAVTPADLREFALAVAEEVKASWSAKDRQDKRLTAKEAAAQLGASERCRLLTPLAPCKRGFARFPCFLTSLRRP